MKKHQLLSLGGAMLATTALSTVAQAGTIVKPSATAAATNKDFVTSSYSAYKLATQVFVANTGASTQTLGGLTNYRLQFTNAYTTKFNVSLFVTGAQFSSTSLASGSNTRIHLYSAGSTTNSYGGTISSATAGCSVQILVDRILVNNCLSTSGVAQTSGADTNASFAVQAMQLSGITYTAANGLATAGATVALGGTVADGNNPSSIFEQITQVNVVTSNNALTQTVQSVPQANVDQTTTPTAFTKFTAQNTDSTTGQKLQTATLASVTLTGVGAVYADLTAVIPAGSFANTLNLTLTSGAVSDPAVSNIRLVNTTAGTPQNVTAQGFGGTTVTFTISGADSNFLGTNFIDANFNGTTAISAQVAGTVQGSSAQTSVTNGGQTLNQALPNIASGATAVLARAGLSTQINTVQSSTNPAVTSYIRITNNGTVAGAVTITVINDGTGATLGTYTTPSITANSTLQVSAKTIETAAGITPSASIGSYTLNITGPLTAYVQHITQNAGGAAGVFTDFSSRRNN